MRCCVMAFSSVVLDVFLADQLVEALRPVFSGDDLIHGAVRK